jgi:ATP-dependent DNA helicase RecG
MLNNRGGRVLFGVGPIGSVSGMLVGERTLADIRQALERLEPAALPTIDRVALGDGHEVIVITVDRGSRPPYTFEGRAYRRVGNDTVRMNRDEFQRLLNEELHGIQRWENQPAEGWSIDDLDAAEISQTIDEAVRRGRHDEPGTRNPETLLRALGLLRGTDLLRAAVVLFGREDRLLPDFPQCLLRMAHFRGYDKSEFIDNRQVYGNAFALLRQGERFLRQSLPIAGRVLPNVFERQDDPLYPPAALREALANAICHRDYAPGGGSIGLAIYDDRLEVTSPGALHFGMTPTDLYREHESRPWNPLIARVFYARGMIENWGRGTLKMTELTQIAGQPKPEFEEISGAFLVRFRPSPDRHRGVGVPGLSARQQDILRVLQTVESLSAREIVQAIRRPMTEVRSVRSELVELRERGLIQSTGKRGLGSRWFIASDESRQNRNSANDAE